MGGRAVRSNTFRISLLGTNVTAEYRVNIKFCVKLGYIAMETCNHLQQVIKRYEEAMFSIGINLCRLSVSER